MSELPNSINPLRAQHERPFLFSWNRRLRHLHGVSFRNIDTTPTVSSRARGKPNTDDDAPYSLTTPTKRFLRNEAQSLTQSRSFTDLAAASKDHPLTPQKTVTIHQKDGMPSGRPSAGRRRRSTLHWSTASPRARQQKLEDVAAPRLADTCFSLHSKLPQISDPIYVSEVMEKSMNPSFAFFDLEHSGPLVSRSDDCVLRLWAKDGRVEEFCLLLELDLNLRSLQYIGRSLEHFHHPLPRNCVLLHLSDGIYTSFTDLPSSGHGFQDTIKDAKHGSEEIGTSFDALMQLANLDDCIQDALKTRARLEGEIDSLLSTLHSTATGVGEFRPRMEQKLVSTGALATVQKQKALLTRRKTELIESLKDRREAVRSGVDTGTVARDRLESTTQAIKSIRQSNIQIVDQSTGQLRRIGETLLNIFPIEPVKHKALQFNILNIHLPNSVFDDTNRDDIAAALGFTSQLVHQLSLYLFTPLPYPIEVHASASFILDPISVAIAQRKYPLHPTNVAYKFEYGVFLLNKNVEFLMNRAGLRVLDIRHTLPNLKYLLYVLTAGTGELPARKAGGVRGLLGGRLTPSISRRGSDESVQSHSDYLKRASLDSRRNGSIMAIQPPKEKPLDMDDPFYASPRAVGLPYRHSTLRETG